MRIHLIRIHSRGVPLLAASLVALAGAMAAPSAFAQATRTWVSGVGDDANPCSRTAPCKTFAGAISKTATGGLINSLDPGGFGAVTITKPISLDGAASGTAGVLAAGTNGIIINIDPAVHANGTVVLRNLNVEGAGSGQSGVQVRRASKVVIEHTQIQGFQTGVEVQSGANAQLLVQRADIVNNSTAGISLSDANSKLYLSDSSLFGNATAFSISAGNVTTYNNNRLEGNTSPSTPTATLYER
ncbi:right-handed parallel beta-helix repeat-containing protein [Comamonas sp.]|uniref:right-handed parallel beta-helix repeat-containing protein n=1 Tax=Comamonas sp. TaxID=34028 RepID=UPI00289E98A8|nr:right-handed parallel beta-helix repeat-containing protein [Comamonas sp.]